jgi:hypothetical protein
MRDFPLPQQAVPYVISSQSDPILRDLLSFNGSHLWMNKQYKDTGFIYIYR